MFRPKIWATIEATETNFESQIHKLLSIKKWSIFINARGKRQYQFVFVMSNTRHHKSANNTLVDLQYFTYMKLTNLWLKTYVLLWKNSFGIINLSVSYIYNMELH